MLVTPLPYKWIPVSPLPGKYGNYKCQSRKVSSTSMFKDIGFLFVAGIIIYDALTGRVSTRAGGRVTRREHPILFWIMIPIPIFFAAVLLGAALQDFYHRLSP